MKRLYLKELIETQSGATMIFVAICIFILVAFTALAVDLSHLFVAHNELQNAADAGALAGAGSLYLDGGLTVNEAANQVAYDAAIANKSEKTPAEVKNPQTNEADIQRGHWSFGLGALPRGFTQSNNTDPVSLWDVSTVELDQNPHFINAVKVVTRREKSKITSFFAKIFRYDGFEQSAEAVAYIGFAGDLRAFDVDQPIAICEKAILNESGAYTCNVGKMVSESDEMETAAFTDLQQPDNCKGGTNDHEVNPLICAGGNPQTIHYGKDLQVINGEAHDSFKDLWECWWRESKGGTQPWKMTLPVIDCSDSGKVKPCEKVLGAVTVNVVWINDKAKNGTIDDAPSDSPDCRPCGAPLSMAGIGESYSDWSMSLSIPGEQRWDNFIDHFNLDFGSEDPMDVWTKKTIFFVPDCQGHDLKGLSGGKNYGIMAKIPVIVD
jgi:Flp pilus assembly protein TadG